MLGHGLVSSALFFLVGFLYDRYLTRLMFYYGGLIQVMPVFSFYFILGCLSNLGLPGMCNFIGEILIFLAIASKNIFVFLVTLLSIVFSGIYSLYLYARIINGNISIFINNYFDIFDIEILILILLLVSIFLLGIFPNCSLDLNFSSIILILEKSKI